MAYLTLFLPKISEKFTEKIPTFGEGGQAGWAKFPTFTENLFLELPLHYGSTEILHFNHTLLYYALCFWNSEFPAVKENYILPSMLQMVAALQCLALHTPLALGYNPRACATKSPHPLTTWNCSYLKEHYHLFPNIN